MLEFTPNYSICNKVAGLYHIIALCYRVSQRLGGLFQIASIVVWKKNQILIFIVVSYFMKRLHKLHENSVK